MALNKHLIARRADRLALKTRDRDLAADCTALVDDIDAGKGGIPAKLDAMLAGAWMRTARGVAAGTRPVKTLREIAELEASLGLTPKDDADNADDEPETDTETDTDDDTETESEDDAADESVTSYSSSSYGYGTAS